MNVLKSVTIENGQLVIINDATTTRLAASPLTQQLIGLIARPLLDAEERAAFDMFADLGCKSLVVRDRHVPGLRDEEVQQVQGGEGPE